MKLSNRKKLFAYRLILIFLSALLVFGIILLYIEITRFKTISLEKAGYVIFSFILIYLFYRLGKPVFEYDSTGEALVIRNSGLPFSKITHDEFPKYKLISYEIITFFFFKRIYLKLKSRRKEETILKYEISFVNNQEINRLKKSLEEIIEKNKKKLSK